MKTAVEWLIEQMQTNQFIYLDRTEILNKAKLMEKEQIIEAFSEGAFGQDNISGKQYYNQTFKSE